MAYLPRPQYVLGDGSATAADALPAGWSPSMRPPPPAQPPRDRLYQQQQQEQQVVGRALQPARPESQPAGDEPDRQSSLTHPAQGVSKLSAAEPVNERKISFEGCIVCRLRKKKCDQRQPACDTCKRLNIECLGYQKKRPEFLRDKAIAQQVRTNLTAFLARMGKMPNRGRGPNSTSATALEAPSVEDPNEKFEFAPYERLYHAKASVPATGEDPAPHKASVREAKAASTSRTKSAPARPSAAVVQRPAAQDEPAQAVSFLSTNSDSTLPGSTISTISSGPATPLWPDSAEAAAPVALDFSPESAYTRAPISFVNPLPAVSSARVDPQTTASIPSEPWHPQIELPLGLDVQYGPFATPQWQTDALVAALRSPARVPRPLDSPLLRLDLPKEQYELIQIYVTFIDVYASIAVSEQELRQHNKLHHQLDHSEARCDCVDEALVGKTVTYRALRDETFVDSACALASKFREKKLWCAAKQDVATGGRAAIVPWLSPVRNEEAESYRHKAYTRLISSLHSSSGVDILTALFSCQRQIWLSVYDGGVLGWQQPLVAMRWCLESLFSTLHSRGVNIVDVERLDQRILFLLRRVVTIDIAACISQESSTPLYPVYQALLTSPHFHLSTGSDLLSHVSSSNTICRIFLEASVLKAWKRASGPAIDQLELAARAAPIQALIDTLLGGSFEESLKMFGFDYFSSPFRTMNFLCSQICCHAGSIYLSATVHGHDPTHPAIATAVSSIIDLVSILPTKLCLPAIVFPLLLGSLYAMPVDRPWFVDVMSPETLGIESECMGNVGPMRVLRDEVWRRQDEWEAYGRIQGADRVDWLLVMRSMRMEILLM